MTRSYTIGIQLYSVRENLEADFRGTLALAEGSASNTSSLSWMNAACPRWTAPARAWMPFCKRSRSHREHLEYEGDAYSPADGVRKATAYLQDLMMKLS
ncbi:MAG: hypothetical protein ACYC7E_09480 [Armatimonadota bacterium]